MTHVHDFPQACSLFEKHSILGIPSLLMKTMQSVKTVGFKTDCIETTGGKVKRRIAGTIPSVTSMTLVQRWAD
jgi:hypothetical protein